MFWEMSNVYCLFAPNRTHTVLKIVQKDTITWTGMNN